MQCKNCLVGDLEIEVKLQGDFNASFITEVYQYLQIHYPIKKDKDRLWVTETALTDLYDFCHDHMNGNKVVFRIGDQPWQLIGEVHKILEAHWIDEVINKQQVISYYKPIINSKKEIYAYELLARFVDENGKLIFPNEIFAAARSRGRLYALDRLCRMTAVKNAIHIPHVKAFINFIPTSIYSPEHCLKSTTMLADQLEIKKDSLVFEVVETDKVDNVAHLKSILEYYDQKGFSYALDDVGEGYSTATLLEDLSPRYMKLDMKYVQGVSMDKERQKKAKELLQVAKRIESIPLAEGVETEEDFEWLKEAGFQLFQGYLFGKPAPTPQKII